MEVFNIIRIGDKDKNILLIDLVVAQKSKILRKMLNNEKSNIDKIFFLPASRKTIRLVEQWCIKYKDIDTLIDENIWDKNFIGVDFEQIFEILLLSIYLKIEGLEHVCFKALADLIKETNENTMTDYFNGLEEFYEKNKKELQNGLF